MTIGPKCLGVFVVVGVMPKSPKRIVSGKAHRGLPNETWIALETSYQEFSLIRAPFGI